MRFVCDAMLGKLARYLRMLGLDAPYINRLEQLKYHTDKTGKTVFLTRRITKTMPYDSCIIIKSEHVNKQLYEIKDIIKPFIKQDEMLSRCIECNTPLDVVKKNEIEQLVPEYVFHHYDTFRMCPSCRKLFWKGSHTEHMAGWMETFMANGTA